MLIRNPVIKETGSYFKTPRHPSGGPPLIRNKMKAALKAAGLLPGVQVEIAGDRLWFRLAVTKKTKDRLKVSRNFLNLCM